MPIQIKKPEDIEKLIDLKKSELEKTTKEVIDREMNLLEFNLFISCLGKNKLGKIDDKIQEIRKKVSKGEIDLSNFKKLAEEVEI